MTTIDYDKFGHCCKCHKDLKLKQVIDGKVQERFSIKYRETEFLLDDDSRMRVAICVDCKDNLAEEDEEDIMKCVVKGWDISTNDLVRKSAWTEEKKKDYMKKYSKLKISCKSEGVPEDILKKKKKDGQ